MQGLLAGHADIIFDNLGVSLALVKSGQLKLLAVASAHRLRLLPDVPSIAETIPGFASSTWVGAFLPPQTPPSIAARLSADFAEAIKQPDIARKFLDHACEPVGNTPAATAAFVRDETERWTRVIKAANIKLE